MLKARTVLLLLSTILWAGVCLCITGPRLQASAQEYNRPAAHEYYEAGLKLLKKGSYEKALQQAEATLKVDRDYAPAWFLKSDALVGLFKKEYKVSSGPTAQLEAFVRMKEAADSLERYLRLVPDAANAQELRMTASALRAYGQLAGPDDNSRTVFRPSEATIKAKILSRPAPGIGLSRENGIVVLLGVLADDGKVKHLMVLEALDKEVTQACLKAASAITFTPATKDGRSVSTVIQMEYHFDSY